jgi:succinyl-diaminopimelate desuccinylase
MATPKNVVELTRELVRINSMNPPGRERECAYFVGRILQESGLLVTYHEFADGRTSLIARLSGTGSKSPLCFAGHIDTVPLGANPWSKDPFAGEISDGKLYGRGSCDMKAGVAAYVWIAQQLAKLPKPKADLLFIAVAGEETGCQGSFHLVQAKALGSAGALVVAEPTSNYPIIGHRGALWLEVEATGVTAHGSMPHLGVNAIYKAARAINKVANFKFDIASHPQLGAPTYNVGTVQGGLNINSVPDRAVFSIDLRTIPGQVHEEIQRELQRYLGDEVTTRAVVDVPGVWTEADNTWIKEVFDIVTPIIGEGPTKRGLPAFTDAAALTPGFGGVPTVILGPGDTELAHRTDEYCRVSKIEEVCHIYETIVRHWCEL